MQSDLRFNSFPFRDSSVNKEIDYKAIYTSCYPMIKNMVLKNSGSIDDAKDLFQDSILILFQNTGKESFQLNVGVCTYLYSIARNIWLKQIRNHGRTIGINDSHDLNEESTPFENNEKMQKQRLLIKHLNNLGDKCQNILKLFFEGKPGEEIAKELEFSTYEYYRLAKNRCTENLKLKIQNDPNFKELL